MKKILFIVPAAALACLSACSSGPASFATKPLETVDEYVPRERNPNPAPDWMLDEARYRSDHEKDGDKLYFGEGDLGDDRELACDHARQVAEQKMAKEMNSLLEGTFSTDKTSSRDSDGMDVAKDSHKTKKADSRYIAQIAGVSDVGTFWEKRDYSKSGGKNTVYYCASMIRIEKKDFEVALKRLNDASANGGNGPKPASQ